MFSIVKVLTSDGFNRKVSCIDSCLSSRREHYCVGVVRPKFFSTGLYDLKTKLTLRSVSLLIDFVFRYTKKMD